MGSSNTEAWQATLTPHRSLSREGFLAVMTLVVVVNLVVGALFMAIGAWPVAGFAGLDVLIIWWAFRANFKDAHQMERISITDHELILERLRKNKPDERHRMVRRWVRVELEEDRDRDLTGRLLLVSGKTRLSIGHFLSPEERRTLASALKSALAIPRI